MTNFLHIFFQVRQTTLKYILTFGHARLTYIGAVEVTHLIKIILKKNQQDFNTLNQLKQSLELGDESKNPKHTKTPQIGAYQAYLYRCPCKVAEVAPTVQYIAQRKQFSI